MAVARAAEAEEVTAAIVAKIVDVAVAEDATKRLFPSPSCVPARPALTATCRWPPIASRHIST